jgi:2-oxoglutarate dehydrogenase E1 component
MRLPCLRRALSAASGPRLHRVVPLLARPLSTKVASGPPHPFESFLNGSSGGYIEDMYHAWRSDPESVHVSWRSVFARMDAGAAPGQGFVPPPTINAGATLQTAVVPSGQVSLAAPGDMLQTKVLNLIHAYQARGHNVADLDPLGLYDADLDGSTPPDLELANYGFTEADMDREVNLDGLLQGGFIGAGNMKLRDVIARLNEVYSSSIGVEYMHIWDHEQVNWIRDQIETPEQIKFTKEEKIRMLDRLCWSDHFEAFLAQKYATAKRFGLEGCEVLVVGMKEIIDTATEDGVENVVMGMPHRGRLNVLANVVRKPMEQIFSEFQGTASPDPDQDFSGSGDVKYHLGMSYQRPTVSGKNVHLSLVANPSHLEAVNPVVEGKTRAKQHYAGDTDRKKSMSLLLHGDAAFSGQGVVFETMGLSDLHEYTTGGTVHIVVNNQIGFTTDPRSSRSSPYCTDVAKAIQAPIFHVNGDDTEAVARVCRLAAQWRQRFHRDVVIDIVCYRKFGHNELDQPKFTQPQMYTAIDRMTPVFKKYSEQLIAEGTVTQAEVDAISAQVRGEMEKKLLESKTFVPSKGDWLSSNWSGMLPPNIEAKQHDTGVDRSTLEKVGQAITTLPADFSPHRMVGKIYAARNEMIGSGKGIDWALAEQLAWGTLLYEGNHVRISGQDVERGTFSHRHCVVHDQKKFGEKYAPLRSIDPSQAAFNSCNSSLSEFAVLGFELGYSLENPASLVMWEAQFGDFANTAQCMIDQFICSGEQKWLRQSGLCMLLPHGYEGQGPEHSSARLERFLQMCDDDEDVFPEPDVLGKQSRIQLANWQIVNVTTPANYFHVLRRQVWRDFRKPMVVMSPKSLLRHKLVKSDIDDFLPGSRFKRLLPDTGDGLAAPDKVRKLVLCTGKVYYDLLAARTTKGLDDVAIARVEQISPFPFDLVQEEVKKYPNAEVVWCQEEPKNAGAWQYARPRIVTAARDVRDVQPLYAGRKPSASTATGYGSWHTREMNDFLDKAL